MFKVETKFVCLSKMGGTPDWGSTRSGASPSDHKRQLYY